MTEWAGPPESKAMAAFLQGWLAMDIQKEISNPARVMKVSEVRIDTDAEGNYEHEFVVVYESGAAVKVTVEPFDPDADVTEAIRSIRGE